MSLSDDDNSAPKLRDRIDELETALERCEFQLRIEKVKDKIRSTVAGTVSEGDWQRIVEHSHRLLSTLIRLDALSICLFDAIDSESCHYYIIYEGGQNNYEVEMSSPAVRQAFASGTPIYRRDKSEITRVDGSNMTQYAGSIVDVPFSGGTLGVNSIQENAFSKADISIIVQFCTVLDEELNRLTSIRHALEQDKQLSEAKQVDSVGILAAGVAHNFNNILQAIMGNIYMAKLNASSEQQRSFIEEAELAGERAAHLVRQLRLSVQPNVLNEKHPIDPTEYVHNAIELARDTFDIAIDVEFDLNSDIPMITTNPSLFEQTILNVILNARDAVISTANDYGRTPRIDIRLSTGPSPVDATAVSYLRIDIIDNGCGMDSVTQERIYDPFFTTKGPSATGLGLSTVRKILEDQGGHMLCESSLGEGTHFSIYMPLDSDSEVEEDNSLTVLVADGEEIVRNSTRSILEHHGYNTLIAGSGQDAIKAFRYHRPDLLLLDPSISDGPESDLFTAIQHIDPAANILVLAGDECALSPEILDADTLVIRKPYLVSDLLATIKQAKNT
ncbi:MAG: ATP-binding protein [Candidatus Latescibacterota bacterium]|nr:ATP-binding protein [Candidatus Latescibacterota bacterium]